MSALDLIERVERKEVSRGCGSRVKGGVYLCTGLSEEGLPIEAFMIDPVKSFPVECFRAPLRIEDPNKPGLSHLAIWVGAEYYPSPVDFIEETKRLGVSRRIPKDFDLSFLTPGESRMFFIHPKAYTEMIVKPESCPARMLDSGHGTETACLGAHWHFAKSLGSNVDTDGVGHVGQCRYSLPESQLDVDRKQFAAGAFLQLPITHVEYEAEGKTAEPEPTLVQRIVDIGLRFVIVDSVEGDPA